MHTDKEMRRLKLSGGSFSYTSVRICQDTSISKDNDSGDITLFGWKIVRVLVLVKIAHNLALQCHEGRGLLCPGE